MKMTNIKNSFGLGFRFTKFWAISVVKMILVLCFSNLVFAMRLIRMAIHLNFTLSARLSLLLLSTLFLIRVVVLRLFMCRHVYVTCIMWFIPSPIFQGQPSTSSCTLIRLHKENAKKVFGGDEEHGYRKGFAHTPIVMSSTIALAVSKTFLFCHLF